MANNENLKNYIKGLIYNNQNKAITGNILQEVLINIIQSAINQGYLYYGIATPSTNPGTLDQNLFYVAFESGNYVNFGLGYVNLEGKIGIIVVRNNAWAIDIIDTSTPSIFTAMPLMLTNILKKTKAVKPTTVKTNSIIRRGGIIDTFSNYSVQYFSNLKKNESFIIDIKNQMVDSFVIFMIKDLDDNIVFTQLGHPNFTLNQDGRNVITMPCDGSIIMSIEDNNPSYANKLYKAVEIKAEGNYAPYIPFYIVEDATFDESSLLEYTNVLTDYIITSDGTLVNFGNDFSVYEYNVKKGDTYFIKIGTEISNTQYAEFALYDETDEAYFVYTYEGATTKKNILLAKTDGKLRCSVYKMRAGAYKIYSSYSTSADKAKYLYSDVLWIGTSIPEGCKYPQDAANELNFTVYNKAIGASGIVLNKGILGNGRDCKDLSETTAEKETRYRTSVGTSDYITDYLIKNTSYDTVLIPYLDGTKASCKLVMFDHGYNDREQISKEVANGKGNIDWSSEDRTTYTGAFRYLLKKIYAIDPTILVVIVGYFSAHHILDCDLKDTCTMQKWIAEHYHLPIIDTWNLLSISDETILGTSISQFMQFCPDGVHPSTDITGRSDKLYSAAIIKAMRDYPGRNADDVTI